MRRPALRVVLLSLLLLALALTGGCRSAVPGYLGAVSIKALDMPMTVVAAKARGEACGSDTQQNIPAAIADALANHPGANAIMNISIFKKPRCIRIEGTAVRIVKAEE